MKDSYITPELLKIFGSEENIINLDFKHLKIDLSPEARVRCRNPRIYRGSVVTKEELEEMRKGLEPKQSLLTKLKNYFKS